MNTPWIHFFFLLAVISIYWRVSKLWQNVLLSAVSLLFYGWIDWRFPFLLFFLILVTFFCGNKIASAKSLPHRKAWLLVSLVVSLGILGYFKYANFFISSLAFIANSIGWHVTSFEVRVLLPVGISFFTFSALTYPLDLYLGRSKSTVSFITFTTFVTFLPKLFAGPIARASDFMEVLSDKRKFKIENLEDGCIRILTGYFKKAVVADNLAIYLVNPVISAPDSYSAVTLWVAMFGYAVLIYADFSGYSNMAIGSAKVLGLRIPENFSFPYLANSFSVFWRKWHITMSTFFRDYVYIPLGGSRRGAVRTVLNLEVTMLICGLWHGSSWTFVAWGGIHGLYLALDRCLNWLTSRIKVDQVSRGYRYFGTLFRWCFTQILICLAWILFSASSFAAAISYIRVLFTGGSSQSLLLAPSVIIGFLAFFIDHLYGWAIRSWPGFERKHIKMRAIAYALMVVLLYHLRLERPNPFIYFQF